MGYVAGELFRLVSPLARSSVEAFEAVTAVDSVTERATPAAVCAGAGRLVVLVEDAARVGRALEVRARVVCKPGTQ